MKQVFQKLDFPKALGGNLYEFKEATTSFEVEKTGFYLIKITATAKNTKQNNSTDDDDLRVILDGYSFGKYFINKEKITWKGFNTASAWNGSQLKGKPKTVNFFVYLNNGEHTLNFIVDNTPMIQSLEVFEIQLKQKLQLETYTEYTSFVFLAVKPEFLSIKKEETTEVKVYFNEKLFKVPRDTKSIDLGDHNFDFIENVIEIYSQESQIDINLSISKILTISDFLFSKTKFLALVTSLIYRHLLGVLFIGLDAKNSKKLLEHSFKENPSKLTFTNRHNLVKLIKKDTVYHQILDLIKQEIKNGVFNGQLHPNLAFETKDLDLSIHGISKIHFTASKQSENKFKVNMQIFDIYDFDAAKYEISGVWIGVKIADELEKLNIMNNYEIEIQINDLIQIL